MPRRKSYYGDHAQPAMQDEVTVWVGPAHSASGLDFGVTKIPLDGRTYKCGGYVILKNGVRLRASIFLVSYMFPSLKKNSIHIWHDGWWYEWDEPELLEALNLPKEEAFPFKWITSVPLDYHTEGPYEFIYAGQSDSE